MHISSSLKVHYTHTACILLYSFQSDQVSINRADQRDFQRLIECAALIWATFEDLLFKVSQ